MKKITTVVLAAAFVLLVFGVCAGAAGASDVEKISPLVVDSGTSITAVSLYPVPDSTKIPAGIVKKEERKGKRIPTLPLFPKPSPVVPMPVVKPAHYTVSPVIIP